MFTPWPAKAASPCRMMGSTWSPHAVAAALLAGAHRAVHHRADDLQVRGVEAQRDVHQAAGGLDVAGEALVILHVAGGHDAFVGDLALTCELVEDLRRWLADDVGQHVQAAAVRHADHDLFGAVASGALDQFVQHRDQRLAAFQREALLTDVARVHELLDALGRGQQVQDPAALLVVQFGSAAVGLQPLLDPALLLGLGDVHVLGADGARCRPPAPVAGCPSAAAGPARTGSRC